MGFGLDDKKRAGRPKREPGVFPARPNRKKFFFFNDTATTQIYTLSLHDALPISRRSAPDVLPRSTSFPPAVFSPPWARIPLPQIARTAPALAPALPPSHAPLSRSPPRAVFRNLADRFSFHRTPAVFPCAAASAASSREY